MASTSIKLNVFGAGRVKTCTSYVERNNLTIRMQLRRFTRLTTGASKKLANLRDMVTLFMAHYTFAEFMAPSASRQ